MDPQCQFYVVRKKRLCRMTVRPGKQYCGEHDPRPVINDGQVCTNKLTRRGKRFPEGKCNGDTRIPCPYDPKHTCYASKLQKHLSICNARHHEEPEYIKRDVNAPPGTGVCAKRPLSEITPEEIQKVIDKINFLYDEHIEGNIDKIPEQPIHETVVDEFSTPGRTESSLRHLRQASSILHMIEAERLVRDRTCYVELGAGKGQLSFYASKAWCSETNGSCVLLIDRASLRHKRDNKLRSLPGVARRLRADLAHLVLDKAPGVQECDGVVGLAKHLCGVATDYALRCVVGDSWSKAVGAVMATCCHHRCQINAYVGELQDLGINSEEFNIMLGIVSWATCGDGRSRERRKKDTQVETQAEVTNENLSGTKDQHDETAKHIANDEIGFLKATANCNLKLKAQEKGQYCEKGSEKEQNNEHDFSPNDLNISNKDQNTEDLSIFKTQLEKEGNVHLDHENKPPSGVDLQKTIISKPSISLDKKSRELVGRRAKALIDWGRVLFLRKRGFNARLCYFCASKCFLRECLYRRQKAWLVKKLCSEL